MSSLALFDIDGTLTVGIDLHVRAFEHVMKDLFGIDYKMRPMDYMGWVDRQIFEDLFRKNGKSLERVDEAIESAVNFFEAGIGDTQYDRLPKVKALLNRLEEEDIGLGLVTGNIQDIAYIKLKSVGISEFFDSGGFGDEATDRKDLVPLAIDRASKIYRREFKRIVLIGDTLADIRAGKKNGIVTIAVRHGYHDGNDLSGADFVLDDFKDTEKIVSIIKG